MNTQISKTIFGIMFLVMTMSLASAIIVNADYVTIYPGESGVVEIEVDNNEDFDIEDISLAIDLSSRPIF
jgi:uncharacterized membrane protein